MRTVLVGALVALAFNGLGAAAFCEPPARKLLQRRWVPVPCRIESTSLVSVNRGTPSSKSQPWSGYRLNVAFRYERGGRAWTGQRWGLSDAGFGQKPELEIRAAAYPAEHQTTCYVHPTDPSMAVLFRERITAVDVALLAVFLGVVPAVVLGWTAVAVFRARRGSIRPADPP